jgi:CBS domain-containing protein
MASGPKTAGDVMTRNPRSVSPDTPAREAAQLMKREDTGALPVVDASSRRPVGIVTDRDLVVRVLAEGRTDARVADAMTANAHTVRENDDLASVMDLMAREQVRRVPIVDDRGELVGIISQADIMLNADDKRAEQTVEAISRPGS